MVSPAFDQPRGESAPPDRIRGRVLFSAHWSGQDLRGRDLVRLQIPGAELQESVLEASLLHGAILRGADLRACKARSISARDIDLEQACLTDADLRQATLVQAVLLEADLRNAQLCEADLRQADLRGADLRGANLQGADLRGADLRGALIEGAVFDQCLLTRTRLHGIEWASLEDRERLILSGAYDGFHPVLIQVSRGARRLLLWSQLGLVLTGRFSERWIRQQVQQGIHSFKTSGSRLRQARAEGQRRRSAVREEAKRIREERINQARQRRATFSARRSTAKERAQSLALAKATLTKAKEMRTLGAFEPLHRPVSSRSQNVQPHRIDVDAQSSRDALRATEQAANQRLRQALDPYRMARKAQLDAASAARATARAKAKEIELELAQQRLEEEETQPASSITQTTTTSNILELPDAPSEPDGPTASKLPQLARSLRWPWTSDSESKPATPLQDDSDSGPAPPTPTPDWTEPLFDVEQQQIALKALDQGQIPGGPHADLRGLDMRGRKLGGANWTEADLRASRLDGARLDRAQLSGADLRGASMDGVRLTSARLDRAILPKVRLDGSRMREVVLNGALMPGASLVDVDLRHADLRGADLRGANLTGADLRRTQLEGCDLREANLTAARMSDLNLSNVQLDHALLDQADLAGTKWDGASILDADLSGALGLSGRDRERLATQGALAGDRGLEELIGRLASKQVRFGIATLALGLGTYLAVHYLAGGEINPADLEAQAEEQRHTDPLGASAIYEELAEASLALGDKVAYRIEAAALSIAGGDLARAEEQYLIALEDAGIDPLLAADVRLHLANFYIERGDADTAISVAVPSLQTQRVSSQVRARTIMAIRKARSIQGLDPDEDPNIIAMFETLSSSPETLADLGMELSELLASQGEFEAAIAQIETLASLNLPKEQNLRVIEANARILDRSGQLDAAGLAWERLITEADLGSLSHQAGRLALADLRHRQGNSTVAYELVEALLDGDTDDRIRGRAWLVRGRLLETEERFMESAQAYESALATSQLEVETVEEARISLARVLLATGNTQAASDAIANLSGGSGSGILIQANLGQARQLIDSGNASAALELYETIMAGEIPEQELGRATQAGMAEALSQLGQLEDAIQIWKTLLQQEMPAEEAAWIQVQLGHGLIQGGQASEAAEVFRTLSLSDDNAIQYQGILGLAEVAQASGERERSKALYQQVVDRAPDAAWQVQALQELALMAIDDGNTQESLAVWRTLLGRVPPGHPAAAEARVSVALAMADSGDFEQALPICSQAMASASPGRAYVEAGLACAEIHERAGQYSEAIGVYDGLTGAYSIPQDLLTDAFSGKARVMMSNDSMLEAVDVLDQALARIEDDAQRLPLLAIQAHALQQLGDSDRLENVVEERDTLADSTPTIAGPILMDAAMRARNQGRMGEARALLERALTMTMTRDQHVGALIELGDIQQEQGEVIDAAFRYEQAMAMTDDQALRFGAGMGLAELRRRSGDVRGAVQNIEALNPPDQASRRWWTEARAQAWAEIGENEQALAAWKEMAELTAGDPSAAVISLRGQAAVLLDDGRSEEALELYDEARSRAIEPGDAGWTELGKVEALIALERNNEAEALLRGLRLHTDAEVAAQAAIRHGHLAIETEEWNEALERLDGIEALHLGPGWDASIVESRVLALTALERIDDAVVEWETLASRWPGEEEALIPSWLGQAQLARNYGSTSKAMELAEKARVKANDPGYRAQAEALIAAME